MRFKPLTFFLLGLVVGLGYIGASFYMHYSVLQKAGVRVSTKVQEYKQLSESYEAASQKIEAFQSEIKADYDAIRSIIQKYKSYNQSFQQTITQIVQLGKQYKLTFLDYHSRPNERIEDIPGAIQYTSLLSLGGSFDNIQSFLEAFQKNVVRSDLPIMSINLFTSQDGNARIQLSFTYLGQLSEVLEQYRPFVLSEPQSFLIFDPWSNGI